MSSLFYLEAASESEGGEAVAWRCTEKHGSGVDVVASVDAMETYKRLGRKIEPLYTHPPKQQSGEAVGGYEEQPDGTVIWDGPEGRTPRPYKWIPCSERLPTEADADCNGCIWVSYNNGKDSYYQHWRIMGEHEFPAGHWLWTPTGLTRPTPPEQESE